MKLPILAVSLLLLVLSSPPASGEVWTQDGITISDTEAYTVRAVPSGNGYAIIIWGTVDGDIFAQKIDNDGNILWAPNGVQVRADSWGSPHVAPDGLNGALCVWAGGSPGTGMASVTAQKIDDSGNLFWAADGVAVTDSTDLLLGAACVADNGAAGAYVTYVWQGDVYAQHLDANGVRQWGNMGLLICDATVLTQPSAQVAFRTNIDSDGTGGAIITWSDDRVPPHLGFFMDIYSQRVDPSGPVWTANGVGVCTDPGGQILPRQTPDGAGGWVIAWQDGQPASTDGWKVYAQRIDIDGQLLWPARGIAVCDTTGPSDPDRYDITPVERAR